MVLAAVERGYYPTHDPTPLNPRDWACLACSMTSAIGQGYHHQESQGSATSLEKVHAETTDHSPLDPRFPTLFHQLAVSVAHIELCIGTDTESYVDWYFKLKLKTKKELARVTTAEVEEKWQAWKADQIDCQAAAQETEIATVVRSRNAPYFMSAANSLGLSLAINEPHNPPPPQPAKSTQPLALPHPLAPQHQSHPG